MNSWTGMTRWLKKWRIRRKNSFPPAQMTIALLCVAVAIRRFLSAAMRGRSISPHPKSPSAENKKPEFKIKLSRMRTQKAISYQLASIWPVLQSVVQACCGLRGEVRSTMC